MAQERAQHTATLLPNGKVLVTGGALGGTEPYQIDAVYETAEVYDPATGTWSAATSMVSHRYQHTATLLPNGKVLVAGGRENYLPDGMALVYDPASATWRFAAPMVLPRYWHAATLLSNGQVLITGGFAPTADSYAVVGYYSHPTAAELYTP